MIVWEIRDEEGDLLTREFREKRAIKKKLVLEKNGIKGIRLRKIFQAEDRHIDECKMWKHKVFYEKT